MPLIKPELIIPTKIIGDLAEERARAYLQQQGMVWVCSNYRCPQGEIDLVMRDLETLVFVEVRFRSHPGYGESVETVVWRKQHRLIKAAWHYLLEINALEKVNARFDVLGLAADGEIYWIQNAIEVKY